ncbi:hypothetical protein C3D80_04265 [Cronobacter sakazakii]|nr:hypothetical protein CsakCS09_09145 [Cronobacter sakazakii]EGZ6857379.1 hypothetical protein [Cronobacter sakazakii]EGZ6866380.1 hypothetical protein [Cronobacter sakazakii]PPX83624.1 hypothetical protein C3D83_06815 [Cronobacter sakazakii]PPX91625.1 hypothetical protein C3D77_10900 [Cronobacter sakazakii]
MFRNVIEMLTHQLPLCVIVVAWSGYPTQDFHVLRASFVYVDHSLPLLSQIVTPICNRMRVYRLHSLFLIALNLSASGGLCSYAGMIRESGGSEVNS